MATDIKKVREVLESSGGKFFSVEFTKKDGSTRKMVASTHVHKYLKGGTSPTQDREDLLSVYDVNPKLPKGTGYRQVPLDRVLHAKVHGKDYDFKGE